MLATPPDGFTPKYEPTGCRLPWKSLKAISLTAIWSPMVDLLMASISADFLSAANVAVGTAFTIADAWLTNSAWLPQFVFGSSACSRSLSVQLPGPAPSASTFAIFVSTPPMNTVVRVSGVAQVAANAAGQARAARRAARSLGFMSATSVAATLRGSDDEAEARNHHCPGFGFRYRSDLKATEARAD